MIMEPTDGVCTGPHDCLYLRIVQTSIQALSVDYDTVFCWYLEQVQEDTNFVPMDQDVDYHFSTNRTSRKTVVTRLEWAGFGDELVDKMNRWRSQEQRKGRLVQRKMNAHCTKAMLLAPTAWICLYFL